MLAQITADGLGHGVMAAVLVFLESEPGRFQKGLFLGDAFEKAEVDQP